MRKWTTDDELAVLRQWAAGRKVRFLCGWLAGAKLRSEWAGLDAERLMAAARQYLKEVAA